MKRNTAWIVPFVVGLGTGGCSGEQQRQSPLESPIGEIGSASAPQTVVRIAEAVKNDQWMKDIAIVGDDLYVTVAWSGVYRLPKNGGGVTAIDEDTNTEFDELASGDGAVFWEASTFDDKDFRTTHIRRVAAGGDSVSTIYEAPLGIYGSDNQNLQVDGSTVYLTQIQNVTNLGGIHRIPTSGGANLSILLPFTYWNGNSGVFPDPWIARDGGVFVAKCDGSGSCAIQRVTGDGEQTVATIAAGEARVRGADESGAYVVTGSNPSALPVPVDTQPMALARVEPASGAVTALASDCGCDTSLLIDAHEIFFVTEGQQIDAIPKQGGAPRVVVNLTDSHGIWRIAQDDTHLFVLTANNEVVTIPKGTPAQP